MNSIIGEITNETLNYIYKQTRRKKNKRHIEYIINTLIDISIRRLKPYLYTIVIMLGIMFLLNCIQFAYYLKMFTNREMLDTY